MIETSEMRRMAQIFRENAKQTDQLDYAMRMRRAAEELEAEARWLDHMADLRRTAFPRSRSSR